MVPRPLRLCVATLLALTFPATAGLVGWWEFNDPLDPGQATAGPDLGIVGTVPTHAATLADDSGLALDGVITTQQGPPNRLRLDHSIGANGGGNLTNHYTIVADVFCPPASRDQWRAILQTNASNANDLDFVIRNSDDKVGIGDLGYSGAPFTETRWTRLAVSFDNGTSIRSFLDGTHLHQYSPSAIDGRFALGDTVLFFADDNGSNHPLSISTLAIYDQALTASQLAARGTPGTSLAPITFYVDESATGTADGKSWENAFTDLQVALASAIDGDEIWVAEGTYVAPLNGFDLHSKTTVLGGFPAGGGDGSLAARNPDPASNNTVLSGDYNLDGDPTSPDAGNSLHVVRVLPGLTDCGMNGFTIRGGYADSTGNNGRGGGIFIHNNASPVLENLILTDNHAINDGGGVMVETGGTAIPVFRNVTFTANTANDDGGAVYNWARSPHFIDCTFNNNRTTGSGAAMYNNASNAVIERCRFSGNTAIGRDNENRSGAHLTGGTAAGGALYHGSGDSTVTNCEFMLNTCTGGRGQGEVSPPGGNGTGGESLGGAIAHQSGSLDVAGCLFSRNRTTGGTGIGSPQVGINSRGTGRSGASRGGAIHTAVGTGLTMINCSFSGNLANRGNANGLPAIVTSGVGGAIDIAAGTSHLANSILWGNRAWVGSNLNRPVIQERSGTTTGANNIIATPLQPSQTQPTGTNPLFVNAGADNLRLQDASPAIGIGDDHAIPATLTTDLDGAARIRGLGIDLGAYESDQLGDLFPDVRSTIARGEPFALSGWTADATAETGGTGYTVSFTEVSSNIAFLVNPTIDPDGTLRFTLAPQADGTATFEVVVSDPNGVLPPTAPHTITITTPAIYYIDQSVVGGLQDGSSWANAFPELRDATAQPLLPNDEIWVAEGTYLPTDPGNSSREDTFEISQQIGLYGGFPPGGSTFEGRNPDPATNNCVLSGEINNAQRFDNSYNVVRIQEIVPSCVIDGFTIRDGYADGIEGRQSSGGGIFVETGTTPILRNLILSDNEGSSQGGALAFEFGGDGRPLVENVLFAANQCVRAGAVSDLRSTDYRNCIFRDNEAWEGDAGAMAIHTSNGSLANCIFEDNFALGQGGAISVSNSSLTMTGVQFLANATDFGAGGAVRAHSSHLTLLNADFRGNEGGQGGGIYSTGSGSLTIINSLFSGNTAHAGGGGIFAGANLTLLNSTIVGNSALGGASGGGMVAGGTGQAAPLVQNTIIWGNTGSPHSQVAGPDFRMDKSKPFDRFNDSSCNLVQDGIANDLYGVVSQADPRFADPLGPDGTTGTADDDLNLLPDSPAISRGDHTLVPAGVTTDLAGKTRFFPLELDLGAYESETFKLPPRSLDTYFATLSDGSPSTIRDWVAPNSQNLDFAFHSLGTSGDLQFDSLPSVAPNGDLVFTITPGTYGTTIFDVHVTDPAGLVPPQQPFTIVFEADNNSFGIFPDVSYDTVASTALTSSPKSARIRGYFQRVRPRKGIVIFGAGFSQDLPGFLDHSANDEIDPDPLDDSVDPAVTKKVALDGIAKDAFREGFDVYTIRWHDPRTYIEDNAMVFADFLEGIAGAGVAMPGRLEQVQPGEKVALIPVSMDGLVARFALCYLDTHATPYQCDLFLTVDSPHEGAYIPIGLQFVAKVLDDLPAAAKADVDTTALDSALDAIDQPAPRQMLVVHHSRADQSGSSHGLARDQFRNLLENTCGSWPTKPNLRLAAVASGRGDGLFEKSGEATFPQPPTSRADRTILDWNFHQTVSAEANTPFIAGVICFYGKIEIEINIDLSIRAFAVDPSASQGRVEVMNSSEIATIEVTATPRGAISGDLLHDRATNDTATIDTSVGSFSTLKSKLRQQIRELGGLDGFNCDVLDDKINEAIDGKRDDLEKLVGLRTLDRSEDAWSAYSWDWLPGGVRDTGETTATALAAAGTVSAVVDKHCFIPTTSALALSSVISPQEEAIPFNAAELSPFDALYHFGTHHNTTHLHNSDDIEFWLSQIVVHELKILCNEFAPEFDEAPHAVSYLGPYLLQEFAPATAEWVLRDDEPNGVYLLPDPSPSTSVFRLTFPEVYEWEVDP